jgi:hypothetical protein
MRGATYIKHGLYIHARIAVFAALGAIGCYSPSPPAGAYRCSSADSSCPTGQHCTCGLCVNQDSQAACGFTISTMTTTVNEHETFDITLQALMSDGKSLAASFNGTVTLAATWGDVRPTTVTLANGKATVKVSLNRETLPPQTTVLSATFAGNKGQSRKIAVTAPMFVRDVNAIVPPASPTAPYAFADTLVAEPDVVRSGGMWRMYFAGFSGKKNNYGFGLATSTDGTTFTPAVMPIFENGGTTFDKGVIQSPSAFASPAGTNLAFEAHRIPVLPTDSVPGTIGLAQSSDGVAPFMLAQDMPILATTDCGYCGNGIAFPSVIADPSASPSDGGVPGGYIMFFSATATGNRYVVNISRASSSDGLHFTPEPAPLLNGDFTGEAVLLAPRVIVDGTVFKMFYSFARGSDLLTGDLCASHVSAGYATSNDGFYWIRSPSNPVMSDTATPSTGWDATTTAFLVGSVVPSDGSDPHNGISLYYTTFRHVTLGGIDQCLPNGIGRATRP